MPVQKIAPQNETFYQVWSDANKSVIVLFSSLTGTTNAERAADLQDRLQNYFDKMMRRTDLPNDDPDRAGLQVNTERYFQEGQDLITRNIIVSVVWLETAAGPEVTLTQATDRVI